MILTFAPFWSTASTALVVPDEKAKSPLTTPCTASSDSPTSGAWMVKPCARSVSSAARSGTVDTPTEVFTTLNCLVPWNGLAAAPAADADGAAGATAPPPHAAITSALPAAAMSSRDIARCM